MAVQIDDTGGFTHKSVSREVSAHGYAAQAAFFLPVLASGSLP